MSADPANITRFSLENNATVFVGTNITCEAEGDPLPKDVTISLRNLKTDEQTAPLLARLPPVIGVGQVQWTIPKNLPQGVYSAECRARNILAVSRRVSVVTIKSESCNVLRKGGLISPFHTIQHVCQATD